MENIDYSSHLFSEAGPEKDVIISSRIRLARNIEDISFPNKAKDSERKEIVEMTKQVIADQEKYQFNLLDLYEISDIDREILLEKHLISRDHAKRRVGKALFLNNKQDISIMVNEEDHFRIQVLSPGMDLDKLWKKANEIDDLLEENLDFAFSEKWGYLTACPTNVGTGLRASIMCHLPALNLTNRIDKVMGAISQLGLAVRGMYGEGSNPAGNIYQISNQITLGHSEEDIIDNLKSVNQQIVEQERKARQIMLNNEIDNLKDAIKRSFGVLKYAYTISSKEALQLLSDVKLGIDLGIINDLSADLISELLILIRPAHLKISEGRDLTNKELNIKRAEMIQEKI